MQDYIPEKWTPQGSMYLQTCLTQTLVVSTVWISS